MAKFTDLSTALPKGETSQMLHDALRFYPGGDRAIEVELGDGMDFTINFLVHRLVSAVREAQIDGLQDLIPELASFQVNYDPDVISFEDLSARSKASTMRLAAGSPVHLPAA